MTKIQGVLTESEYRILPISEKKKYKYKVALGSQKDIAEIWHFKSRKLLNEFYKYAKTDKRFSQGKGWTEQELSNIKIRSELRKWGKAF
jgi:hypothetical protein